MKKSIIAFILLFPCLLFAQQDSTKSSSKLVYGMRLGSYLNSFSNDICFYGYFSIDHNKHEFAVGPSISRKPYISQFNGLSIYSRPFALNGVDINYRIYPNGRGKVFAFFFQADIFMKRSKISGVSSFYDSSYGSTVTTTGKATKSSQQFIISTGFNIHFLKVAYFTFCYGAGIGNYAYSMQYDNFESHSTDYSDLRMASNLSAGLGLRF